MSAEQVARRGDLTEQIERGLREVVGTDETEGGEVLFNVPSGFNREPITLMTAGQLAERIAQRCASALEVEVEVEVEDTTKHRMVPGSHERPDGPECTCGRPWSRWDAACVAGDPS